MLYEVITKWLVPYENGKLEAVGEKDGQSISFNLATAGAAAKIDISTDKTDLAADGYDVAHIIVQLTDNEGNPVRYDDKEIEFSVDGDVELLGVDNGNNASLQTCQASKLMTSEGRALLLVRSMGKVGKATISAHADGLDSRDIHILIE